MSEVLRKLEGLFGDLPREDLVSREGNRINVPETMTYPQAARFLVDLERAEEAETIFQRMFSYRPWDGGYVAYNVMREVFGAIMAGTGSPFDPPGQQIEIPVSSTERVSVPWGDFTLPHLPGAVITFASEPQPEDGLVFAMRVAAPKKYRYAIENLFRLIEEEMPKRSIYKGKAIDGAEMPEFLDLSSVDPAKVVYSAEVMSQLEASIFAPIRWPEQLRRLGVSLKRAVLLHGDYGTGKTLAGYLTGQEAVKHGWTFLYVRPGKDDLQEAMRTARLYAPAVVFFEDVETVGNADHEAERVSVLLDLFDGIQAKGAEVMAVLTSNHAERLHKGLVRPGRLDAIIEVGTPDAEGIRRLVEMRLGDSLRVSAGDWPAIADAMSGFLPAFVVEAASRSVTYALTRQSGKTEGLTVTAIDLLEAAQSLSEHRKLMSDASEGKAPDVLSETFRDLTREALLERFPE